MLSSVFSQILSLKTYELFSTKSLPLKSLNYCGRHISFPNQTSSSVLASTRSHKSNIGSTDPKGVCGTPISNNDYDTSSSVVVENSLYYNLEKVCLGLRFMNYNIDSSSNIYITFLHDTTSDRDNIAFLILLNPLYIEFTNKNGMITQGYRISEKTYDMSYSLNNNTSFVYSPDHNAIRFPDVTYASHIDKISGKYVITLKFIPIIDPNNTSCDITFDYKNNKIDILKKEDLETMKNNKHVINLNAYFLDDISTSFQKPSRTIKLNYDLTSSQLGKMIIYWSDYDNDISPLRQKQLSLNEKKFMNNIRIMYSNYIAPTMTFSFDINISKLLINNLKQNSMGFLMCYVDDGNEWISCSGNNITGGKNNNNIFSFNVKYNSDELYYLTITTSKNTPADCNADPSSPDCLNIKLPYNGNNDNTRLFFTISPNQKILYAQWFSHGKKIFSFAKTKNCPSIDYNICNDTDGSGQISNVNNNYATLFTNTQRPSGNILQNIVIAYNKQIVKQLNEVHLGYQNLYKINNI